MAWTSLLTMLPKRIAALLVVGTAGLSAQACERQGTRLGNGAGEKNDATNIQAAEDASVDGIVGGSVHQAYPSSAAPLVWLQRQEVVASNGAIDHEFGHSVALSGETALVGAPAFDSTGFAHVLVRSAGTWIEQQILVASDGAATDWLGFSVALSGDTALVGAPSDTSAGISTGSAYIFVRSATTWTEQQKLTASDGGHIDWFGRYLALDGDTALVAAPGDDDLGTDSGSAYIFVRSATTWTEQQKLTASDGAIREDFGSSVAVHGDTAFVGAYRHAGTGAVYVFERSATNWKEEQKLFATNGQPGDWFGGAISVRGDTAIVGATGDYDFGFASGAAYVFMRNATTWAQQQKLVASNGAAEAQFGSAISLSGDYAILGAPGDHELGSYAGAAYLFARSAVSWTQQKKLLASYGLTGDEFGFSRAVDGETALAGAIGHDDLGDESGAAFFFRTHLTGGEECATGSQCASDFCTDGFCCNFACDGPCEACNEAGREGTCTLATRGTAPTPSCLGNLCNGTVASCPSTCAGDGDCTSSHYCSSALKCVPKKFDGVSCTGANVCNSGHCADGVCCAQACNDGCGTCAVAGSEGACMPLDKGLAGTPSCTPYVCGGQDVTCPSSCMAHGDCASDHNCEEGICRTDGVQGEACTQDDSCKTGHCTDGVCCLADSCGAYRCGQGGTCETSCSSSAQCVSGHQCSSAGRCDPIPNAGDSQDGGSCHLASISTARRAPTRWGWLGGAMMLACLNLMRRRRRVRPGERRANPCGSAVATRSGQ